MAQTRASNQSPSFPKGPVLPHLRKMAKPFGGGREGAEAQRWGRPPRPPRPGPPGTSPPVGGAHAGAHTHTIRPGAGRWPFLLQDKGSLLRSHKSRQDPLFQQALWANRRNSAEFPNGTKSLKRWEQLKERENNRPPALFYQNLCQYTRIRPGRPGLRSFVREEGKRKTYFYYQGPKGVLNIHILAGCLPLTRVET